MLRVGRVAVVLSLLISARAGATPEEEANAHFIKGTRFFNLTRYDDAVTEYEAAYTLVDDPRFLFNIAQAHRLAGHLDKAVRFYRNYIRLAPDSPQRAAVEERIGELEKALAAQQAQVNLPPQGTLENKPVAPPAPVEPGPPAAPAKVDLVAPAPTVVATAPPPKSRALLIGIVVAAVVVVAAVAIGVGVALSGPSYPTPSFGTVAWGQ